MHKGVPDNSRVKVVIVGITTEYGSETILRLFLALGGLREIGL